MTDARGQAERGHPVTCINIDALLANPVIALVTATLTWNTSCIRRHEEPFTRWSVIFRISVSAFSRSCSKERNRLPKSQTGIEKRHDRQPGSKMDQDLKIVIVDESAIRAAILEEGLREAGYRHVVRIGEMNNLLARIYTIDPDVIVIDLENPSRDVLEQMFQVSRAVRRPVAMFVDQSDADAIRAAVDAGVSAYIVDGLRKERITTILDLCISRFNAFARLQNELEQARSALDERKVIDRAKGILMKAKNLSEEEAYGLMRRTAMNENKKVAEIAQSIITAAELLK
jgi:two-component system, response regulator / RNA-binding antiterminator